ncbi:MAG: hypothetical protein DWB44_09390 [Chloroflexi bacterium]|nr:hypothetical protein [Chloroflexota bacterium]OQY85343.1 MAG: hypothetical protein B6D42_03520 [Anaerolineae bacterium UTCFX5]RIK21131.1 MAG: hypothetical protein DCC53_08015 [Chloroflexota bacterium]
MRPAQHSAGQVGVCQPDVAQITVAQVGFAEPRFDQIGLAKVGPAQVSAGQVDQLHDRLCQSDVLQPRPGQVMPAHRPVLKMQPFLQLLDGGERGDVVAVGRARQQRLP